MKILLAEPDGSLREELRQWLEDGEGHRVMSCTDVDAALKLLGNPEIRCEVVVMELAQPGGTGRSLEFIERLRANPIRKQIHVVAYTGAVDRTLLTRVMQLGVRHYLAKPLSKGALVERLNKIDGEIADIEPIEDLVDAAKRLGINPGALKESIAHYLSRAELWIKEVRAAAVPSNRLVCASTAHKLAVDGAKVGLREVARQLRNIESIFGNENCPQADLMPLLQATYGELAQTRSMLDLSAA